MNVSVTPELEQFVQQLLHTGRYGSASEVIRDGLRLLEAHERNRLMDKWLVQELTQEEAAQLPQDWFDASRNKIRKMLKEGLDAANRGELEDGEAVFNNLLNGNSKTTAGTKRKRKSAK